MVPPTSFASLMQTGAGAAEPGPVPLGAASAVAFNFVADTAIADAPAGRSGLGFAGHAYFGVDDDEQVEQEQPEDPAPDASPHLAQQPLTADPDDIARHLALDSVVDARDLDRLRRTFALQNHPDRVPESVRDIAVLRMQIANGLIDERRRTLAEA